MRQEYNIMAVSDEHYELFLEASIEVLKDLRAIMGNWDGVDSCHEETQALFAGEIFDALSKSLNDIKELNEGAL